MGNQPWLQSTLSVVGNVVNLGRVEKLLLAPSPSVIFKALPSSWWRWHSSGYGFPQVCWLVAGSGVSWEHRAMWDAITSTGSGYFASPCVPRAIAGIERSLPEESSLPTWSFGWKCRASAALAPQGVFNSVCSSLLLFIVSAVPQRCGTEMNSQYNVVVTKAWGAIEWISHQACWWKARATWGVTWSYCHPRCQGL